jgi:hypothetical protein
VKRVILALAVLIVALRFLPLSGPAASAPIAPAPGEAAWTCAMHPSATASAPGECPICGMALVQRSRSAAGSANDAAQIEYSAAQEHAADIRTVKVVRGYPRVAIRLSGRVTDALPRNGRTTVEFAAFPADLPLLRFAQRVSISSSGLPGETLRGSVTRVGERIDQRTNTAPVEVRVADANGRLRPGLPVSGVVKVALAENSAVLASEWRGKWLCPDDPDVILDAPGRCPASRSELQPAESLGYVTSFEEHSAPLLIPDTAPLMLGTRAVVYVRAEDRAAFSARPVVLGTRGEGVYTVQSGLADGETVVVNGAVRIDSDLQIRGLPSLLSSAEPPPRMSAPRRGAPPQPAIR